MKVYDCFTFWKEKELLYLRLKHLWNYVDKFVIVEASITHRGNPKDWNLEPLLETEFAWAKDKIIYIKKELDANNYDLTHVSPSYDPNSPYFHIEYDHRNAILEGLTEAEPDDIIMIGDVDEIPSDLAMLYLNFVTDNFPIFAFGMRFFNYYFDVEQNLWETTYLLRYACWNGTVVGKRKNLDYPQSWRDKRFIINYEGGFGFHFSWLDKNAAEAKFKNISHDENTHLYDPLHVEKCFNPDSEGKFRDLLKRDWAYSIRVDIENDETYPKVFIEEAAKFPHLYYKLPIKNN